MKHAVDGIPAFKSSLSVSQFIILIYTPIFSLVIHTLQVSIIILSSVRFDIALALMTSFVISSQVALLSFSLVPAVKRKYVLSTLIKHVILKPSAERLLTQNAIRALSGLPRRRQVRRVIVSFIHSLTSLEFIQFISNIDVCCIKVLLC